MNGYIRTMFEHIATPSETRKAKELYRKTHPVCEWDGCGGRVEVHHIIPVHIAPQLADAQDNLITLGAKRCHLVVGHANHYRDRWVPDVRAICSFPKSKQK